MIKDKSRRIKKLEEEQKIQHKKVEEMQTSIDGLKDSVKGLNRRISSIENWMAKPCLQTALEVHFKTKMNLPPSCETGLLGLLRNPGFLDSDILTLTGISKSSWWEMYNFLSRSPGSRNETVHVSMPDKNLVEVCFDRLKSDMSTGAKSGFYSFLLILESQ